MYSQRRRCKMKGVSTEAKKYNRITQNMAIDCTPNQPFDPTPTPENPDTQHITSTKIPTHQPYPPDAPPSSSSCAAAPSCLSRASMLGARATLVFVSAFGRCALCNERKRLEWVTNLPCRVCTKENITFCVYLQVPIGDAAGSRRLELLWA